MINLVNTRIGAGVNGISQRRQEDYVVPILSMVHSHDVKLTYAAISGCSILLTYIYAVCIGRKEHNAFFALFTK